LAIEKEILTSHRTGEPVDALQPVMTLEHLAELQQAVRDVRVDDSINEYLLRIVQATRTHPELSLGISTRGALTLYRAAQSYALLEQRAFVIPDDIKRLAVPVLAHRAISRGLVREGQRDRVKSVIRQILEKTPVPQ
jgi:MoxR-like ATPase